MKHLTHLPVWIGFSENCLCIRPIRYSRNAADRKSSTSKQVDTVNISFGRGNEDKTVLSLVVHLAFWGTTISPLGGFNTQLAGTVQKHATGCVLTQTWVNNQISTFTVTLSHHWLLLLAKLFPFLYWTQS